MLGAQSQPEAPLPGGRGRHWTRPAGRPADRPLTGQARAPRACNKRRRVRAHFRPRATQLGLPVRPLKSGREFTLNSKFAIDFRLKVRARAGPVCSALHGPQNHVI